MNDTASLQRPSSPVFIVGTPRSGTTLLLYMLRSHPRLFFPDEESHFIIPMYKLSNRYNRFQRRDDIERALVDMHTIRPVFFRGYTEQNEMAIEHLAGAIQAAGCKSVAEAIDFVYSAMANLAGKARWGDKTPYYALHLPTIMEMFPDAKVVNMVRDGRDVALSLLERRYDMDVYNVYFAAKYWEQYVTAVDVASRSCNKDSLLNIRYEDLLDNPEQTLKSICQFLGEEYFPTLIDFDKPKALDTNLLQKTRLIGQPLKSSNQGKWRTKMTARQINLFDRTAGGLLRSHGYDSSSGGKPVSAALRLFYRLHNKLLTKYNRSIRNPYPEDKEVFRKSIG